MKQYCLKSQLGYECSFIFNEAGLLVEFKADMSMSTEPHQWLLDRMPVTYTQLTEFATKAKSTVIEVPLDLTFNRFWSEYDYKVGDKGLCERYWKALTDGERVIALQMIPRYNRFLKIKGTDKIYPERYIKKRIFENEFK